MKRRFISELWREFERDVLSPGVSVLERSNLKAAFYAGCTAILFGVPAKITTYGPAEKETLPLDLRREIDEYFTSLEVKVKAARQ